MIQFCGKEQIRQIINTGNDVHVSARVCAFEQRRVMPGALSV